MSKLIIHGLEVASSQPYPSVNVLFCSVNADASTQVYELVHLGQLLPIHLYLKLVATLAERLCFSFGGVYTHPHLSADLCNVCNQFL